MNEKANVSSKVKMSTEMRKHLENIWATVDDLGNAYDRFGGFAGVIRENDTPESFVMRDISKEKKRK